MWYNILDKITYIYLYKNIYNKHIIPVRILSCTIGLEDKQNNVECGSSAAAIKTPQWGVLQSRRSGTIFYY